jgi:hypothetical protein
VGDKFSLTLEGGALGLSFKELDTNCGEAAATQGAIKQELTTGKNERVG